MTFACLLPLALLLAPGDRITGRGFATRSEVIARHGMAATAQPLATQAALEILRAGGSAVDAAIAANAVLALVEPVSCGPGGDLFAMVWDPKTKKLYGLNGSGHSPRSLTLEEFQRQGLKKIPSVGPLPVTVPGCVDAWCELSKRFGKLPLAQVLAPAIRYAKEGAPITELIAYYWQRSAVVLEKYENFKETYMPGGHAPKTGEVFANPRLAATLEKIAAGGRAAFYEGDVANAIEAYMKRNHGFLTAADMAAHHSEWIDPVSTNYRGYDVWELPPNGQGIAALEILNLLEGFDVRAMGFGTPEYAHVFIEAKKLAFEDRARWYADPEFAKIPVAELISKKYAEERRKLIRLDRAARSYPAGNPALEHGDTTYLTTADESGCMVSLIQSNYRGMGSGMTPDGLGFMLQDRGELFDLEAGHLNTYAPGKRPFHTIIPAFVTKEGEPYLAFGVMGGATQPQGHVQILVNLIDFGMNTQEAGDAPRMLHDGSSEPTGEKMTDGGKVSLESGIPYETARELAKKGHAVGFNVGDYGGYQAIRWDPVNRVYYGASESRKDGQAAGY
ncbi:MAG TPA: gamma-glutamyltransferase [Planctomycetota bacterium]|jgi:gamma-glutamyltranspeptidase/glutathione hydrolase|nr:gamma-glutamyltransferase [Planctomycetota bacterium]